MPVAIKKNSYVLDASVIIALLNKEPGYENILGLTNDYIERVVDLHVSALLYWEVNNHFGRNLPLEEAMYRFSLVKNLQLKEHILGQALSSLAFEIMKKVPKSSFYDASYHALALKTGSIFVTKDKKYVKAAKHLKQVVLLEDLF